MEKVTGKDQDRQVTGKAVSTIYCQLNHIWIMRNKTKKIKQHLHLPLSRLGFTSLPGQHSCPFLNKFSSAPLVGPAVASRGPTPH